MLIKRGFPLFHLSEQYCNRSIMNKQERNKIVPQLAYGICSNPMMGQLSFINENLLLILPDMLVLKDFHKIQSQKFIIREGRFSDVTAVCHFHSKHEYYLVIGESSKQENAVIVIVKLSTEKITLISSQRKGLLKQICVSPQGHDIAWLLLSQGVLYLGVFNTQKNTLMIFCPIKSSVQKISLEHARDKPQFVYLMSQTAIRSWRAVAQDQIKQTHVPVISPVLQSKHRLIDHCWTFRNREWLIIVLAENIQKRFRVLLGAHNENIIFQIKLEPNLPSLHEPINYTLVKPLKRSGFILGGNGVVSFFYMQKNATINSQNLLAEDQGQVCSLSVSQNQELITFGTVGTDKNKMKNYFVNNFQNSFQTQLCKQIFTKGTHSANVIGLSFSQLRSLFCSISLDQTLRIWDYHNTQDFRTRCHLVLKLPYQITAICMYPTGEFIGIAFKIGFKILAFTKQQFVTIKQVHLSNCIFFQYSSLGHFFVTNDRQNLLLYDSISFKLLGIYSLPLPIKAFSITSDDLCMAVQTMQHIIFHIRLQLKGKKYLITKQHNSHVQTQPYNCFIAEQWPTGDTGFQKQFVGGTAKKFMVIYNDNFKRLVAQFKGNCSMRHIKKVKDKGILVVGTSNCRIRAYSFPFVEARFQLQYINSTQARYKEPIWLTQKHFGNSQITAFQISPKGIILLGKKQGHIVAGKINIHLDKKDTAQILEQDRIRIKSIIYNMHYIKVAYFDEQNSKLKRLRQELSSAEQKLKLMKDRLFKNYKQQQQVINLNSKQNLQELNLQYGVMVELMENQLSKMTSQIQTVVNKQRKLQSKINKEHNHKTDFYRILDIQICDQIEQIKQNYDRIGHLFDKKIDCAIIKQKQSHFHDKQIKFMEYSNMHYREDSLTTGYLNSIDQSQLQQDKQIENQVLTNLKRAQSIINQKYLLISQNYSFDAQSKQMQEKNQQKKLKVTQLLSTENLLRIKLVNSDCSLMKAMHLVLQRQQSVNKKQTTLQQIRKQHATLTDIKRKLQDKTAFYASQNQLKKANHLELMQTKNSISLQLDSCQKQIDMHQENIKFNLQHLKVLSKFTNQAQQKVKTTNSQMKRMVDMVKKAINEKAKDMQIREMISEFLLRKNVAEGDHQGQYIETAEMNQITRQKKWMQNKKIAFKAKIADFSEKKEEHMADLYITNVRMLDQLNKLRKFRDSLVAALGALTKSISNYRRQQNNDKNDNMSKIRRLAKQNQAQLTAQRVRIDNIIQMISCFMEEVTD